ncbi:MAG: hypothetical protein VCC36_13995 [Gammaproteobacteria bacterium]
MPYLAERFEAAVSALVAEGSVKDRLSAAYLEHLDDLETSELPQGLRTKFDDLHTALHAVRPIGREPCIKATIRKMSRLQAGNHARTIVSIYAELVCRGERAEPLKAVNGERKKAPRVVSQGA